MNALLFKGTGRLTRLIFRQERFKVLVWLLGLIGVTLAAASAYPGVYPDEQSRQAFVLTVENPAMVAMLGPGEAIDVGKLGTIFSQEMLLFTAVVVAIMNILLVGRSTRADEEEGRVELVRSLPVGRLAYFSAAMNICVFTNLVLAVLTALGLGLLGVDGIDWNGSILYGALLGVSGLIFGALAALFAQLAETSRGTTMLSFSVLISAYLLRAVGDVSFEALSFFSPLGWIVRAEVYTNNLWWPVCAALAGAIVLTLFAFTLNSMRDLNSGFIPSRKGKKHASAFLRTSFGLVLRLQRTSIISWAIGMFLLSASFGSIFGDLETYYADNEFIQAYLSANSEFSMTEQFLTLLMAIMSLISVIPAVMTVLKLKGEETKKRTENLYSRAVSRTRILGNYFGLAIIISFLMQTLNAVGLWAFGTSVMEEPVAFAVIFKAALVYLPAMLFMLALAILLIGAFPKATAFVWLYVAFCFVLVYLGDLLDVPDWLANLSSFEYVPQIPIDDMSFPALITMTVLAFVISVIGFFAYNKRDITG